MFLSQRAIKSLCIGSQSARACPWICSYTMLHCVISYIIWPHTFPHAVFWYRTTTCSERHNFTHGECLESMILCAYRLVFASVAFRLGSNRPLVSPNRIAFHRRDHAIRTFVSRFISAISVVKKDSENNCNNLRAEKQHGEINCLLITKKGRHLTSPYKINALLSR